MAPGHAVSMDDPPTGPTGPALPAAPAALLLRVWFDHLELRARLLSVVDGGTPTAWSVAQGEPALAAEVHRWVAERRAEAGAGEVAP